MSSASEPSEPDLKLGLMEKLSFESSSDAEILTEPQGDYCGEYKAYADDDWGLQPFAFSPIYVGCESPAADPSVDDTEPGYSGYLRL
jgi:hypothetical protein